MSELNSPANDGTNSEDEEHLIKLDQKFVINLPNQNNKIVEINAKQSCKVLQISSELNIDQQFELISTVQPSDYPNLFIFIVEHQNRNSFNENQGSKAKQLEDCLIKFETSRPLVTLHTFKTEDETKFYYKAENSTKFVNIDQYYSEDLALYEGYKESLQSLLGEDLEPFEDQILKKLSNIKDSSIVLRFLRTLTIQRAYFGSTVLKIAKNGSKADFLAVLDAPFHNNGRILNNQAQNYIRLVFDDDESPDTANEDQMEVETDTPDALQKDQDDPMDGTSLQPKNKDTNQSVLLTAVQHSNQAIIDYLISYWSTLIQQLPVEHQVRISTTAFDTNQRNVLCDLLDISDFPFPDKFTVIKSHNDEKLARITADRVDIKTAIERGDFTKIDSFIDKNQSHKFIYSIDNHSALTEAVKARQFGVFYYLKSLGFRGKTCQDVINELSEDDKKQAVKQASEQKRTNLKKSLQDCHKSVWYLSARSLIHNRKISKEKEVECRSKIREWLKDIHKIAPEMLDVAATCEHLKIIFDFESHWVENASLEGPNASGSAYTASKRIYIGADFTDREREQKIKGVIAHELCHYVMNIVYENQELPFLKIDKQTKEMFKGIVALLDKWSITKEEEPDDECGGIISTVYRLYLKKDFGPELIVRVVNILAHFDDNQEKSDCLRGKYQVLFDFWYNQVVPKLKNHLEKNQEVIRLNGVFGLLQSIRKHRIEFSAPKDLTQLTDNKLVIISTNVPTLVLINIHKYLQEKYGGLLDSQNLFLNVDHVRSNQQNWKDYKQICTLNPGLNIFVDCSKDVLKDIDSIFNNTEVNYIAFVSNDSQYEELKSIAADKKLNDPIKLDANYSWMDLTPESQQRLLKSKINFQNDPNLPLNNILSDESDLHLIIDDKVLNLLLNKHEISINSNKDENFLTKHFEFLFQARQFISRNTDTILQQDELLANVKNKQYVLISDIAGTGKSWTMRNFFKTLRKQNTTRWSSYVDLKQFIDEFRNSNKNPEFATFFLEKILKSKDKFEIDIFKNLYKNGKVTIFLDAFDEIAPDCAEFVADLAKSFQFNGGNQMWIATRDYFQVNLQQKLEIDAAYKLDKFTEPDGIKFIVNSWILSDQMEISSIKSKSEFDEIVKNSQNAKKYQQKARQIVRKVAMSSYYTIGLPQLFKMIADGFKDDKFIHDLKGSKIFSKFADILYQRWAYDKGQLRTAANVKSQKNEFNLWCFLRYSAVKSFFPEFVDDLFPNFDITEWPEEEIIACGFMTKIGDNFFFLHETFREYFLVEFIVKELNKRKVDDKIVEIVVKILTIEKYEIVQLFLNDAIEDTKILDKIQPKMQEFVDQFYTLDYFNEFFVNNLENLAYLLIKLLKSGDYEKVKDMLNANAKDILGRSKELKIVQMFQEFLVDFLEADDVEELVEDQELFHEIIGSSNDIKAFEDLVNKVEIKIDREFIQQGLMKISSDNRKGNIFYFLCTSQNLSATKVQKGLEIIQRFLTIPEIIRLIESCNNYGQNIFEVIIEKKLKLNILWKGMNNFLNDSQDLLAVIKRILKKSNFKGENFLHSLAQSKDNVCHETLWEILQITFEQKEELKDKILLKASNSMNFIHYLITNNNTDVLEFTIKKLNENLNLSQLQEVLDSKGNQNRNILQLAIGTDNIELAQILWKNLKSSFNPPKILKFVKNLDSNDNNLLIMIIDKTDDMKELILTKVFKFLSNEDFLDVEHQKQVERLNFIIQLIKNSVDLIVEDKEHLKLKWIKTVLDIKSSNDLEPFSLDANIENHKILWKHLVKRFSNNGELIKLLTEKNIFNNNFLHLIVIINTSEVIEFTFNKFRENMNEQDYQESLSLKEDLERNLLHRGTASSKEIQNHQIVWKKLRNSCDLNKKFLEMLAQSDHNGSDVFNFAASFVTGEIFEYMEAQLQKIASRDKIKKLFINLGCGNKNLLQAATHQNQSLEFHRTLWKILKNYFTLPELLEFAIHNGENNALKLATLNSNEVLDFTWKEFKQILTEIYNETETVQNIKKCENVIQKILETGIKSCLKEEMDVLNLKWIKSTFLFDILTQNFLKSAFTVQSIKDLMLIVNNKNVWCHEILWENLENQFENKADLAKLLLEKTEYDNNFLHLLVILNSSDVIEFTIQKLKNNLNKSEYQEVLRSNGEFGRNLLQVASIKSKEVKTHRILWKELQNCYKSNNEFLDMISESNFESPDVLCLAVIFATGEIIQFMFDEIEKIASREEIRNLLKNLNQFKLTLLHASANQNKSLVLHKVLWKFFQKYFNSNEMLNVILNFDIYGDNLLINVINKNTKEIVEFIWTKVKAILAENFIEETEQIEKIGQCDAIINKFLESGDVRYTDKEVLRLKWIEKIDPDSDKFFDDDTQMILKKKLKIISLSNFIQFYNDKDVKNHEVLWKTLKKLFKTSKEMKNLFSKKNINGKNFVHLLVIYNTADVIDFTLNKLQKNMNESDFQDILRSKGEFERNLLHVAAVNSKEVKTQQILWKVFQNSSLSFEEILSEVDFNGDNILSLAATFSTAEIFNFFIKELEKIKFKKEMKILIINLGFARRNLLQAAANQNKFLELHKTLWEILEKYFDLAEILQLVQHFDVYGYNVVINAIESNTKEVQELTWNKVRTILVKLGYENNENFVKCDEIMKKNLKLNNLTKEEKETLKLGWVETSNSEKLFKSFIELLEEKIISIKSLKHLMPFMADENIENHKILWEHLEENVTFYDKLKSFFFEKDRNGDNFIHLLVIYNTADVIKFTLNKLKKKFVEQDYQEILRSKGQFGRNFLHCAAMNSKEVKTHQILSKESRGFCKSYEELLKIFAEVDEHGSNVLGLAATFSTAEILKFIQTELEKIASKEKVKELLTNLGFARRHLLQAAAQQNNSLELNNVFWEILKNHFNSNEILEFIKHCDVYGNNVLFNVIKGNTKEVKELTWNEVKQILINVGCKDDNNIKLCEKIIKNVTTFDDLTEEQKQILKLKWIDTSSSVNFFENYAELLRKNLISIKSLKDLKPFIGDENVENHKILWKHLENNFASCEELKKLLLEKDKNCNNFIHLLVIYNTADVIEFTLNLIKNKFDYQEILRSKGQFGRNLLHRAAMNSKEVKTHQILWKIIRDSCKSNEKFIKILDEIDEESDNVFHLAAAFTTREIFEFMILELEMLQKNKEKIIEILTSIGKNNSNLLQFVVINNRNLETHNSIWQVILKCFEPKQILEFIEHCDIYGDNLLCCAVYWNKKEIVEFTWNQIKTFLNTKEAQFKYLNKKGRNGKNLLQLSLENKTEDSNVATWVQQIMQEYEI